MSLLYSILKPVLRKTAVKKADMTRADFVRQAERVQKRDYKLPKIKGYEKQDHTIAGCRCIVYSKQDKDVVMGGELQKQFREFYDPAGAVPKHIAGCAAEDDYSMFPPTLLGFGGDEMMSGDAPDFEAAFQRCNMKDYEIHIEPDTFHAYPVFTFTPEGRKGEQQVISYIREKIQ